MKESKEEISLYKNQKDVRGAFISLYTVVEDSNVNSVEVIANELLLYGEKIDVKIMNRLILRNGNIYVDYYRKFGETYTPIKSSTLILNDVEEFNIIKRGEILWVEIVRKGERFVKYM